MRRCAVSSGAEHYREAEKLLSLAVDDLSADAPDLAAEKVARAQAHATLALAGVTALNVRRNGVDDEMDRLDLDAIRARAGRAWANLNHERLCMCTTWPERCVNGLHVNQWDTEAIDVTVATFAAELLASDLDNQDGAS